MPEAEYWLSEYVTKEVVVKFKLKSILYHAVTPFQTIQVAECMPFGLTLILDGKTQSSEKDEFIYHESLVHPSLLMSENPKNVFIGGGGEGATAREILKHRSIEKCIMVDIDKEVVEVSKKMLPTYGNGCWSDPRLEIHFEDALAYLKGYNDEPFDVIYMDISDPIEAGPGYKLYTKEFYEIVKQKLKPNGIFVTQSGPSSLHNHTDYLSVVNRTLREVFGLVVPYLVEIPSFGSGWSFTMAFNSTQHYKSLTDINRFSVEKMDEEIERRIEGELRFLSGAAQLGLFGLPKFIEESLDREDRVMTLSNPVYMH
mmetsp:Transcript_19170/g.28280  ORF Transcript_19170/g.28280 Transcript_19170/m.28280 type:complete len:313 (+) Transcript_19170:74-1012(+)